MASIYSRSPKHLFFQMDCRFCFVLLFNCSNMVINIGSRNLYLAGSSHNPAPRVLKEIERLLFFLKKYTHSSIDITRSIESIQMLLSCTCQNVICQNVFFNPWPCLEREKPASSYKRYVTILSTVLHRLRAPRQAICFSVTRLDDLWKYFTINILSKVTQTFDDFLAILTNAIFKYKLMWAIFGQPLENGSGCFLIQHLVALVGTIPPISHSFDLSLATASGISSSKNVTMSTFRNHHASKIKWNTFLLKIFVLDIFGCGDNCTSVSTKQSSSVCANKGVRHF